jgi:hypothetical protein
MRHYLYRETFGGDMSHKSPVEINRHGRLAEA